MPPGLFFLGGTAFRLSRQLLPEVAAIARTLSVPFLRFPRQRRMGAGLFPPFCVPDRIVRLPFFSGSAPKTSSPHGGFLQCTAFRCPKFPVRHRNRAILRRPARRCGIFRLFSGKPPFQPCVFPSTGLTFGRLCAFIMRAHHVYARGMYGNVSSCPSAHGCRRASYRCRRPAAGESLHQQNG